MPDFAEPLARLINEFKRLPGIGQKSAQRLAFHVLRASREDAEQLSQALLDVKDKLGLCRICNNISDGELCMFCRDPNRDQKVLCVVEEAHNIVGIEVTRQFNGLYHVLHGCALAAEGHRSGATQDQEPGGAHRRGPDRRGNRGDQSDGGRRGDRGLSFEAAQAAGSEGDAASPWEFRSAAISNSPTKSLCGRPWKAAAKCSRQAFCAGSLPNSP